VSRAVVLAAALVAAATAAGCRRCTTPTFTVRSGAALDPRPAPELPTPAVRVLHVTDFGDRTCQQDAVAAAIARAHGHARFDAAIFPGDSVYPCGPDPTIPGASACAFGADSNTVAPGFAPPDDPSFARHEAPLAPLLEAGALPVYLSLGNHDVATWGECHPLGDAAEVARLKACLEVAHASPVWTMPGRHYLVDLGPARLIVVDTNLLEGDYGGFSFDDEVAFVAEAAQGCADRTCFLVGHHPAVMAGAHADEVTPEYRDRVERLVGAGGGRIRAWLAGHDHDLQHLRTTTGLDVFVSGNGSRGRDYERFRNPSPGAQVLFGSVRWGYAILEVSDGAWRYRFEGDDGAPLYCCAAVAAGRCEPVACR
jgi:tartrate-resistant acid phosphatase type 5